MEFDPNLLEQAGIGLGRVDDNDGAIDFGHSWPEPQPLPSGLPSVPLFDEYLLPESLRPWVTDIAERAQAPLDFAASGALVALTASIGQRLGIRPKRHDDWLVVPNLWGLIVGPPGFLKSPMLHEVLKPLVHLEARARQDHETAVAQYELRQQVTLAERKKLLNNAARPKAELNSDKLMDDLRRLEVKAPVEQRYIVNDPTVEKLGEILNQNPQGVLLFRDEITGFLANMERAGHENDRAFYLEAWNGTGGYVYDRIGRGTLRIEAACASILGAITPGPLGAYLRETFSGQRDDGLIQRFQVSVYPDAPAIWRNVDRRPHSDAKNRAYEVFESLVALNPIALGAENPNPGDGEVWCLRFDDEAQDFFNCWRNDLEARLRNSDEHAVMLAHLAKYRSLMPTLALILHLADFVARGYCGPVALESARRAAALCDYLQEHARRIYHSVVAQVDIATRLLGDKIRARKLADHFTTRDVYRHEWTSLTDPRDVARALDSLSELYWVRSEPTIPTSTGGRPILRYRINPRVWP